MPMYRLLVLSLLSLASCTGSSPGTDTCTPGEIRGCTTGTGSETCEADGRWGACERIAPRDGGLLDAGSDTGSMDAGPLDAGSMDAASTDASGSDAGSVDAGADSGSADAGISDSGISDSGISDSGAGDSGTDAGGTDAGLSLACGPTLRCDGATHYCSEFLPGVAGAMPSYSCVALPAACAAPPTCACVSGSGGGACSCRMMDGKLTVTCAGA